MKEPKIRFKGFEGEWHLSSFNDVGKEFKYGLNAPAIPYDGGNKYLRITDIDDETRCFMQSQISSPGTNLSYAQDYLLQEGNITFARTGASTGKSYIYHKSEGTVYFAGFLIRMIVKDNIDANFIFQNSLTNSFAQYVRFVSQRSGQPGINAEELKAYILALPSTLAEQHLIASYFQSLDTLIQATSKQLASLKQIKAASLQSMFPQEGETKPRVRFKGFEGEWNAYSFADAFIFLKNNSLSRAELSEYGTIRNIHYGDILIKFGALINVAQDDVPFISDEKRIQGLPANYQLQEGDIIFADAAEDSTVGKCSELISTNKEYVVAGLHTIPCRPQFKFAEGYLGYYLNSPTYHNQLLPLIQGTKISSISKKTMNSTNIFFPKLQEQQRIASYFLNLDRQITLQTRRLEKLKQIKAACLDKMFV